MQVKPNYMIMINPFFQEVTKVSTSTKISNFIFKEFLHVNVEKKTISSLVWCHVKLQLKRSLLNGHTSFSSVSSLIFWGLNGLIGSSDSGI